MTHISTRTAPSYAALPRLLARTAMHASHLLGEMAARRKISNRVGHLPDRYLRDIGLTRHDVASATRLPLPFSSARELRASARSRAGNW